MKKGIESNNFDDIRQITDELLIQRIDALTLIRKNGLNESFIEAVQMVVDCITSSMKIITAGNGGSAAQSQHLCAVLMGRMRIKRSPIKAISLCSDISTISCIANDFGYERVFSRQIEGLGEQGDLFIGFTTSGKSRNILEALCMCREKGIRTIVFAGLMDVNLFKLADCVINIPIENVSVIQEAHMSLIHIICEFIEKTFWKETTNWSSILNFYECGYNCIILDRDGVINHIKPNGYISSEKEVSMREDFLNFIKELSSKYQYIFVVTNQRGVEKGEISQSDVHTVNEKIKNIVLEYGGRIDRIYTCVQSDTYKPNTTIASVIRKEYPELDFSKCVVVGDSANDKLFADKLKCKFFYVPTR